MARREGEVMFKGRSWEWGKPAGGSTGTDHPFRRKSQKAFDRYQKRIAEEEEINSRVLESFGIPVEQLEILELPLDELDRFVEKRGLERAGVDRVFRAFEASRYDHDEHGEGE